MNTLTTPRTMALALVSAAALVLAGCSQDTADAPRVEQLDLVGTPTSFVLSGGGQDPEANGLVPGATFVFTEALADDDGEPVGENAGTCSVVTDADLQCSITTTLADGTLQVHGLSTPSGVVTLTITGGTGRYQGAGGTVEVDTRPENDLLSFSITTDGTPQGQD